MYRSVVCVPIRSGLGPCDCDVSGVGPIKTVNILYSFILIPN
jgi:hypothetical protein